MDSAKSKAMETEKDQWLPGVPRVEGERWNMGDGGQEDYSVCYCDGGLVTTHLSKPMKRTVQGRTLWT